MSPFGKRAPTEAALVVLEAVEERLALTRETRPKWPLGEAISNQ